MCIYLTHNAFFLAESRPVDLGEAGGAGRSGCVPGSPRLEYPAGLQRSCSWGRLREPPRPESSHGPSSAEPQHASFDPREGPALGPQSPGQDDRCGGGDHPPGRAPTFQTGRRRPQPVGKTPALPLREGARPRPVGNPPASGKRASPWPGAPLMCHLSEHTRALSALPGRGKGGRGAPPHSPRLSTPFLLSAFQVCVLCLHPFGLRELGRLQRDTEMLRRVHAPWSGIYKSGMEEGIWHSPDLTNPSGQPHPPG